MKGISMARYPISELPEGYTILFLQGKHFPMKVMIDEKGVPHTHGFKNKENKAVAYSKRVYAAHFIEQQSTGKLAWAEVESTSL
jgi:hypothetical protein